VEGAFEMQKLGARAAFPTVLSLHLAVKKVAPFVASSHTFALSFGDGI